jgi:hypothetical protein
MKTMLIRATSVMLGTYAGAADDQKIDPQFNVELRSADKLRDDAFNAAIRTTFSRRTAGTRFL